MANEHETENNSLPFDEPGLALADTDLEDPLEAAISSVIRTNRPESEARNTEDRWFEVTKDITGRSTCTGEHRDFEKYFDSRLEKLSEIMGDRNFDSGVYNVGELDEVASRNGDNTVTIVGLVYDKWNSRNNHQMLQIDDKTGSMRVVFTDEELKEKCVSIVEDEIVAITGQVSDDGDIIFGDELFVPDIPPSNRKSTARRGVDAVLISDVHFGSKDFSAVKWDKFVTWVRQQKSIEYVLVAGDLVEGIGTYPGQREELIVENIMDQYKIAGEALKQLPEDVDIITSVGNHDSVRLAEPQPTLDDKFKQFFGDNVTFTGNPAMVNVEGVKFLLYHGMSLNPILEVLPGKDIHEPTGLMKPLLEKRHLAPMWGNGLRIAPESEDYLVIDEIPDYFHCGHVHTFGKSDYNGVSMVNTGCWQERTDFQRSKNVFPDVGHAVKVNLGTGAVDDYQF
jgi:DNA polymerase II small subunit